MNYRRTRNTCFYNYLAMSSVFTLPPILFVTFREMYDISYTLLGTLVVVNFCTQLLIDLIFSFYSEKFNYRRTLLLMPLLTTAGLLTYAIIPSLFPEQAYVGLLIGTVVFSLAAGLNEVLLSPTVAALPSANPEADMSKLHSLYGYGVVTIVTVSTVFFKIFGRENWMYLTAILAMLPLVAFAFFCVSPLPKLDLSHPKSSVKRPGMRKGMALCVICIFLGAATEGGMTNWISSYIESALHIDKALGDILGMALFAVLLALTRTVYAKYSWNISKVLMLSMGGAIVCYLVAGLVTNAAVSMVACVTTGICTSMLWPGMLILLEEKYPGPGVAAYALMAAGGDSGAAVAPQLIGIVVDKVALTGWAAELANTLGMTAEQVGLKVGMVITTIFPILGVLALAYAYRYFARKA